MKSYTSTVNSIVKSKQMNVLIIYLVVDNSGLKLYSYKKQQKHIKVVKLLTALINRIKLLIN